MIAAEPLPPNIAPVPAVTSQTKEDEIAPYVAPYIAAVEKGVLEFFATLPAEKQSEVLLKLGEQLRKKGATLYDQTMQKMSGQSILSVAGSLKNHPAAEDYARIMQELREQRKKEAELLYPDEADTESGL